MTFKIISAGELAYAGDSDMAAMLAAMQPNAYSGYTSIVGADNVGGLPPAVVQAAMAQNLARGSLLVREETAKAPRQSALGFGVTNVLTGATQVISVQAQEVFKLERLSIPSDIAGLFDIIDLKVGTKPQFAGVNSMPARAFVETAVGANLKGDTAQISQNVSITVQNISGAAANFRAVIFGPAVDFG